MTNLVATPYGGSAGVASGDEVAGPGDGETADADALTGAGVADTAGGPAGLAAAGDRVWLIVTGDGTGSDGPGAVEIATSVSAPAASSARPPRARLDRVSPRMAIG
jgi:hypothetical protein